MKAKLIQLIAWFLCRFVNKQDFYVIRSDKVVLNELSGNRKFYDIDNLTEYEEVCKKYNFTVTDADVKSRFERGQHLGVIAEDDHYGCWGWYTTQAEDFEVTEISSSDTIPENATILFHYYANETQRRKGYFYDLLRNVVIASKKEYAIVYAYDTNDASQNGIRKIGFRYIGRMKHNSFIPYSEMISKYNREEN